MDLSKIKAELGYHDLIPIEAALAHTVRWYVEQPPARGGEVERNLHDPFNYAAEDQGEKREDKAGRQLAPPTWRAPTVCST
jgi:hypothetical protein